MFNRVFVIVIDSLGIGNPKNPTFLSDEGANTTLHLLEKTDLYYSSLKQLGLYNLVGKGTDPTIGYYTSSSFKHPNNDSLSSHYEMMGVEINKPYNLFPEGLPADLITRIETETNYKVIGNIAGNTIDVINQFGEEQMLNKSLIISTSATDSILNIIGHSNIIPVVDLNDLCLKIRAIIDEKEEWQVGRVISIPYTGYKTEFKETLEQKVFVSKLPSRSVLNYLKDYSYQTITIGKIGELFNNSGISKSHHTYNNLDVLNKLVETVKSDFLGLCFANLNDMDIYGHKRDLYNYSKSLKELDDYLPLIVNASTASDLIIITSDHGNDLTIEGNQHTKEDVPVFLYSKRFVDHKQIEHLETIADIAATITEIFELNPSDIGTSFLNKLS